MKKILKKGNWNTAFLLISAICFCLPGFSQVQKIRVNGITIAYEQMGDRKNEVVLLIAGTGQQLIDWPPDFCQALIKKGYQVIRFDNRDAGLSTRFDAYGEPHWTAIFDSLGRGKTPVLPYTADDMAKDAVGLITALGIKKAHLVGISGGAIIAQIIAAQYPNNCLSLVSFMGTTGNPQLPQMKPEIQALLLSGPVPAIDDTAAIINKQLKIYKALGSPAYPVNETTLTSLIYADIRRSYDPAAMNRQGVAVLVAGDRRTEINRIKIPTIIIHGENDPIVPVEAGRDLAANIPGAGLIIFPGMGHDMPSALIPAFVDAVVKVAQKSSKK
jgi:pimeloyl-ACP methyl ester carboxylesterase